MQEYKNLIRRILVNGEIRGNERTGVGTVSVFNHNMTFDLRQRFPLVTIKETRWKTAFLEMLWFLRGESNIKWLNERGCKLWDAWADKDGNLGPIYGVQWRQSGGLLDQINQMIWGLKNNPQSRRHIVTAWEPTDIPFMALPPCHWAHQCYISNDGGLDLTLFMRSSDVALGLPFNIAQYALLTHLYARAAGLTPRYLHVSLGDAHLYLNHVGAMTEVVELDSREWALTKLVINTDNTDIDGYKPEDFNIEGYSHHPHVKLEVAV